MNDDVFKFTMGKILYQVVFKEFYNSAMFSLQLCTKKTLKDLQNHLVTSEFFISKYSSNKIRRTQNEHHLSKFDRSVVLNLKTISYYFGTYTAWILI